MKKISTPQPQTESFVDKQNFPAEPRKSTINLLKQFARVYVPGPIGGFIVN